MASTATLDQAHEAFDRQAWSDAYAQLSVADQESALDPDDLVRLATAAYLVGRDTESTEAFGRAHRECLRRGQESQAVRCAFFAGLVFLLQEDVARSTGWLARARRVIEERQLDCVEQGYLLIPAGLRSATDGDYATAYSAFAQATKIGDRFGDTDLMVVGREKEGRVLIRLGDVAAGTALLDEAMVAVTAGEVSPIFTGLIYCSVIEGCQDIVDWRRAREWTVALTDWCATHPDLVPYRGQCLVHRSEVMQMCGDWPEAMDEAKRACALLADRPEPWMLGMAHYQRAELHRLRGQVAEAELAYRQASQGGHSPQPGLARLRLAQGRLGTAAAAVQSAADEATAPLTRARVLPAYVEIMLAVGDISGARAASDELFQIATDLGAPQLTAVAKHADGSVLLAEGDPRAALEAFRVACQAWAAVEAPYEHARTRVLVGLARRRLDDDDTARMEWDAARQVFQRLGAQTDLAQVDALSHGPKAGEAASGLSPREVEVLQLVATGKTNHAIATDLFLSDKTVARHVSNIFLKLGISSRSAATAYAYQHGLA